MCLLHTCYWQCCMCGHVIIDLVDVLCGLDSPLVFSCHVYFQLRSSTCGLVAMTSANHAEGCQFDPGQLSVHPICILNHLANTCVCVCVCVCVVYCVLCLVSCVLCLLSCVMCAVCLSVQTQHTHTYNIHANANLTHIQLFLYYLFLYSFTLFMRRQGCGAGRM